MRRIIAIIAAAAAIAAAGMLGAAPAAAVGISVTAPGCLYASSAEEGLQIVPYFLPVASTLTVVTPGGFEPSEPESDTCYLGGASGNSNLILTANAGQTETYAFLARPDASGTIQTYGDFPGVGLVTIDLVVSVCGPDTQATIDQLIADGLPYASYCNVSPPGGTLPPVHQHTTPLPDGSCDIVDTQHNWSGVPSGGWTRSWAEWPNGGTGGDVCTRTLRYTDASGWFVAP
jgi:hypothetical protein